MLAKEQKKELAVNLYKAVLENNEQKVSDILIDFSKNEIKPNFTISESPALLVAIVKSSSQIVLKLLEHHATLNFYISMEDTNTTKITPLQIAAHHNLPLKTQYLLDFGVNINNQNSDGNTALHHASYNNSLRAAEILLKHGADKTIKNINNQTALEMAKTAEMIELINSSIEPTGSVFDYQQLEGDIDIPLVGIGESPLPLPEYISNL
ncbi:MAG: ankyrin repeat domain-containing protein [Rickettsia endosymbiont of Pentastiridius leporinus]